MTLRTVRAFKGRFIALCLIVALSAGFFAGLKLTTSSLRNTGDIYLSEHNMYDFRLYSTLGFDEESIAYLKDTSGINEVEGSYTVDALVDFEGNNMAIKFLSIPSVINTVSLDYGRLPTKPGEVLADAERFGTGDVGKKITISSFDKQGKEALTDNEFTIVGICHSPLYIGIDRGTTSIGSGAIHSFLYCTSDSFSKREIYTEVSLTISESAQIYTEEYEGLISHHKETVKDALDTVAQHRYDKLFEKLSSTIPGLTKEAAVKLGLEAPKTFLLTRQENAGYVSFENDSAIVGEVASVMPIFFILIAILVCITTMTRMVDEERQQLGILKALGFSNAKIAAKYLTYAGGATVLGWALGFFLCTWAIPEIFWLAYNALYNFAPLSYYFSPSMMLITLFASLFFILGSTYISVRRELVSDPAALIRPKATKGGKRIFLERLPFWKKLPFLQKIIFRNMFRYKQRFIMMLVGIGCCCGLLLTAFGVRNSMIDIANLQYESVQTYKIEATYDGQETADRIAALENVDLVTVLKSLVDIKTDKTMSSVNMISYDNWDELCSYWHLASQDKVVSEPTGNQVIVNQKIAQTLDLSVGDTIQIINADMESVNVTVGAIYENYIYNYVFISSSLYEGAFGEYQKNTAFIKTEESGVAMGEKLTAIDGITSIFDLTSTKNSVNDALDCLNYIIWLIVAFCAALAFIVTFNLTNINLAERSREIATVEVLGFYPGETAGYVLRENILLSFVASILGIPIGYLFHYVVMTMVVVDSFTFRIYIAPESYFIAFALSMLFAFAVNLFMRRQIKKIPMVESLKAVE